MGDCKPTIPELEAELVTDDAWKTLANLSLQLSNVAKANESKDEAGFEQDEELNEIEQELNEVRDKIMDREKDESMIWDQGPEEAIEYLKVVNRAQKLTKSIENLSLSGCCPNALLLTAHDVLRTTMARLEEEFGHLLVQNRQPFEPQHLSEEDIVEASSIVSFGDDSVEPGVQRERVSQRSDNCVFELVHPNVIPVLKSIANLMFESNYGQECSQMFVNVQRDALDVCLSILELKKLSIEDVLKMEWSTLRRWMCAVKIFIRVYLAGEKLLSDQIFGEVGSAGSSCFVESSKSAVRQLLNFGEVIAIRLHQPENQFRILGMYLFLSDLIPDINALYTDKAGNDVRKECHKTLRRLWESAKAIFLEFENAVASAVLANAPPGGDVRPLTRYVINYIKILTDYGKIADILLKDQNREDSTFAGEDEIVGRSSCASPMALHFRSLISIFECNLEEKSRMHRDNSLRRLFLLDNIHNMTQSVGRSSCASPMALHLRTLISILERNLNDNSNFVESSKPAILQLLNFGEAISIGPHQPEKLIRILDMHEVLSELIPDIETLYSDETGSFVRTECHETLRGLGESAKATLLEFKNAVASNVSVNVVPGGGVHHLTRYVMNYLKTLADYDKTLNILLKDQDKEDPTSVSPDGSSISEDDSVGRSSCTSPMALHFGALISILEYKLDEKSKMYRDEALQHLFLMNNIHYMAENVKNSELRAELGDEWIRRQNRKLLEHAMSYERATWRSILVLLTDDGIRNLSHNSRAIFNERLKLFNLAFEEVYKSQRGWLIPDRQLCEDLRISTLVKVIQAYRTFVGRHGNQLNEKHIKYTPDDLQDYLFHLFEGAQK